MFAIVTDKITGITTLECSCQKPEKVRIVYADDGYVYAECTECGDRYQLTGD